MSAIGEIAKAGTDRGLRVGDVSLFEERPQTFQNLRPAIVFQPVLLFLPPGRLILGAGVLDNAEHRLNLGLQLGVFLQSFLQGPLLLETELFSISEKRSAMGSP